MALFPEMIWKDTHGGEKDVAKILADDEPVVPDGGRQRRDAERDPEP